MMPDAFSRPRRRTAVFAAAGLMVLVALSGCGSDPAEAPDRPDPAAQKLRALEMLAALEAQRAAGADAPTAPATVPANPDLIRFEVISVAQAMRVVVVSAGADAGVQRGRTYSVWSGGKRLATVCALEVHPEYAAVDCVEGLDSVEGWTDEAFLKQEPAAPETVPAPGEPAK